jgi:hypothetical protein
MASSSLRLRHSILDAERRKIGFHYDHTIGYMFEIPSTARSNSVKKPLCQGRIDHLSCRLHFQQGGPSRYLLRATSELIKHRPQTHLPQASRSCTHTSSCIIVESTCMACIRLDIRLKALRIREHALRNSRNVRQCTTAGSRAISSTENHVVVAREDKHRSCEGCESRQRAKSQDLSRCDWLFGCFGVIGDRRVKILWL